LNVERIRHSLRK